MLREGFRSGKVRLLVSEYDADELLSGINGYNKLSPAEQMQIQLAYINTTLLIDELVKLRHEESGGKVKMFEKSGMRKDRYSSISYNYYVASQLEARLVRRNSMFDDSDAAYVIKAPKNKGRAVIGAYGKSRGRGWY